MSGQIDGTAWRMFAAQGAKHDNVQVLVDGSGLGWSIMRRIADVHDAQLLVHRSVALGGLEVRLNCHALS